MKPSTRLLDRALAFVAPVLLCIVAARQIVLVHTERLTPWKGGGFGMFATVESGATRVVRVRLEKHVADKLLVLPVKLPPELGPLMTELAQRPTHSAAENLAIVLSNLTWTEAAELDEIYRLSAPEFAALALASRIDASGKAPPLLRRVLETPRAWAAEFKSSARFGPGKPVDFDYAVVEVWQLEFDRKARTLKPRQLIDAAEHRVPRRKRGAV